MMTDNTVPNVAMPAPLFPPQNDAADARKADLKRQARELLMQSDWRAVRDLEQHGAVSASLLTYRDALRAVARGEAFDLPVVGE